VAAPDGVTSQANTEVTSFAVGPLKIGQVLSRAQALFSADGEVKREAETRVNGAMVGDTPVAFTDKGLVVGESPIPADPKPIEDALAAAKIELEYMPRQDTDTGVVAPTIRVTQRDESGGSITYVLGRTSAFAQGEGTPDPPSQGSDDAATVTESEGATDLDSGGPPAVADTGLSPAPSAPGEAVTPAVEIPTSFVLPDAPAIDPPVTARPAPAVVQLASGRNVAGAVGGPARDTRPVAARLLISASDSTPLFLVLALGLVSALGTGLFLRRLGSRMR
jgi:hypothetical protein